MKAALSLELLVHELAPKKWVFGSGEWTKLDIDFYQSQGVYLLQKYNGLFESLASGQELIYFTDQNGPKMGPHQNKFGVFSDSEMNVTNS